MVSLLWFCTSPLIIGRGERNLNSIVTDSVFLATALLISYNVHCKAKQTRIKQKKKVDRNMLQFYTNDYSWFYVAWCDGALQVKT